MLDDFELDEMRSAIAELFPATCTILSSTYNANGAGGGTITWGTLTADVACRLDNRGGREQLASGAVRPFNSLVLSMPYDTVITTNHRVEFENEIFLVTAATPLDTSWSLVKRVELERAS